jgi:hypothetical protein
LYVNICGGCFQEVVILVAKVTSLNITFLFSPLCRHLKKEEATIDPTRKSPQIKFRKMLGVLLIVFS